MNKDKRKVSPILDLHTKKRQEMVKTMQRTKQRLLKQFVRNLV